MRCIRENKRSNQVGAGHEKKKKGAVMSKIFSFFYVTVKAVGVYLGALRHMWNSSRVANFESKTKNAFTLPKQSEMIIKYIT